MGMIQSCLWQLQGEAYEKHAYEGPIAPYFVSGVPWWSKYSTYSKNHAGINLRRDMSVHYRNLSNLFNNHQMPYLVKELIRLKVDKVGHETTRLAVERSVVEDTPLIGPSKALLFILRCYL